MILKTTVYLCRLNFNLAIAVDAFAAVTFLSLAPIATFVADVKFGRFKLETGF